MLKACVNFVNNSSIIPFINRVSKTTALIKNLYIKLFSCITWQFINDFTLQQSKPFSTLKSLKNNLLNNSFTHNPQSLLLQPLNKEFKER